MARPATYDQDTRAQLLAAAGRLLRDEGVAALTTRRLASEVGASTTAIYSLFGSKEEIVRAMHRAGFAGLDAHLRAVEEDNPIERLRALAYAYREAAGDQPHLYEVMFACPVPDFSPTDADQQLALGTLMILRDAVADAVAAGALVGAVDTITVTLWAVVHGLASLELDGSLDVETTADEVWATTIDAVLAGLSA